MLTNMMSKSPKTLTNGNGSLEENISLPKNVYDSTYTKHLRSSTPLKKIDSTEDNKIVRTNSSQESSQLGQKECKLMLNLLKKDDSDNIDLNSQDEKLILKISHKNIKHILPFDTTEINTQQLMELNLDIATRNLQSCTQLDTSFKKMDKTTNAEDVIVTASESNRLKDSKPSNNNGETFDKSNSKCTINHGLESESLKETQDSKSSKQSHDLSKQDEDPEIIYFKFLCEEMLKTKSKIGTDNVTINNRVIYFKQVNADVINCVSYTDCASSTNKVKSAIDSNQIKHCNDISKPLASNGCHLKRKMSNLSVKSSDKSSQIDYINQNKKPKLNSSHDTNLKMHQKLNSNTILKKPILNTANYFVVTSSEDEDDCVLINNELPKVQKTMTHKRLNDDSTEVNKRKKEVKPIFTCNPNGLIHKSMLNFIYKNNGQN